MSAVQRDYKATNFITGLRAIAILLVFLIHSGGGGLTDMGPAMTFLVNIGKFGVQIFFVISGFTIFNQFFTETYSLRDFLAVRLFRISIPYYPILLLVFIYIKMGGAQFNSWATLLNDGDISIGNMVAHFTYLSPYFKNYQNTIIGGEWTLGVEVFFYVLFGVSISYGIFTLSRRSFLLFGISFFLVSVLMAVISNLLELDTIMLYWMPFSYGYIFFLGGLAYYLRNQLSDVFFSRIKLSRSGVSDLLLITLVLMFGIVVFIGNSIPDIMVYTEWAFVAATFLLVIFFNSTGRLSMLIENKVLLFFGSISYSFYLIHFMVVHLTPEAKSPAMSFLLKLGVTTLVSFVWYWVFEKKVYTIVKRKIRS